MSHWPLTDLQVLIAAILGLTMVNLRFMDLGAGLTRMFIPGDQILFRENGCAMTGVLVLI